MANYKIYTDSACDIKKEILSKWEVSSASLTLRFTDSDVEYKNDTDHTA